MLSAAISGAVMHPLVVGRDDDTLRTQLLHLTRRFLGPRRLRPTSSSQQLGAGTSTPGDARKVRRTADSALKITKTRSS
jgi:hypothetical protein